MVGKLPETNHVVKAFYGIAKIFDHHVNSLLCRAQKEQRKLGKVSRGQKKQKLYTL